MKKEFSFKSFKRSFSVPDSVNKDGIVAKYTNCVLNINLPKVEKNNNEKNKSIKIS